jgi:hypothetical protein
MKLPPTHLNWLAYSLPGGLKPIIAFFWPAVLYGLPETIAENLKEACIFDMIK